MVFHYVNLTNGIEAARHLPDYRFIRIQSTHCEQKRWGDVLMALGADLLMNLALGHTCVIYDFSNKRQVPRALWQGMELARYVLERVWFDREYQVDARMRPYFRQVFKELPERTLRHLAYFRKFLATECINLVLVGDRTIHDGDYKWYKTQLHEEEKAC